MSSVARLLGLATLAARAPRPAAAAYGQPPCAANEIQGEVQGASGYLCAPRCADDTYNCPTEVSGGASAQPQCMLQDINRNALCGLLCQVDAQCPSGAQCRQLKQVEVGVCLYPISFADWARQSGSTQKLAVGWPSRPAGQQAGGQAAAGPAGFQIAKTYTALQSLKSKYSIDDGDADMLALKELLSSLKAPGSSSATPGQTAATATLGQTSATVAGGMAAAAASPAWGLTHDTAQFEKYLSRGIPGLEQELHDTVWNLEHLNRRWAATHLLTGLIWVGLLYLGVGGFLKYQQGARGADMIPHVAFWSEYPRLVNDGVTYSKILLGVQPGSDTGVLTGGITTIGHSRGGGGSGSFDPL